MPRSGTTLIEQILSSHPAVAAGGELNFWGDRLRGWEASGVGAVEAEMLLKAADEYRAVMREIGPEALRVTDKRPSNFEFLWPIRLLLPARASFIAGASGRYVPVDLLRELMGASGLPGSRRPGVLLSSVRAADGPLAQRAAARRFTEVEYETLIADREAETRRLVAFCGLDWDDACLTPERMAGW